MKLWTIAATAGAALILSTGSMFGTLVLTQVKDKRPSGIVACPVTAGEVLVIVASIDGATVTASCQKVKGRTSSIATDAGKGPAILLPPPAGSAPASEATTKESI